MSTRRGIADAFFLALNTLVFSAIGIFWDQRPAGVSVLVLLIPLVAVVATNLVWRVLLLSYRSLNSAKFEIVRDLEQRPPAPVSTGEWSTLTDGSTKRPFRRLTSLEQSVALVVGAVYLIAFALAAATAAH